MKYSSFKEYFSSRGIGFSPGPNLFRIHTPLPISSQDHNRKGQSTKITTDPHLISCPTPTLILNNCNCNNVQVTSFNSSSTLTFKCIISVHNFNDCMALAGGARIINCFINVINHLSTACASIVHYNYLISRIIREGVLSSNIGFLN